jgi:hypothetical protein
MCLAQRECVTYLTRAHFVERHESKGLSEHRARKIFLCKQKGYQDESQEDLWCEGDGFDA